MILEKAIGILGIILILFLCWLLSENKKAFPWRMVIIGLSLQVIIAIFIMKVPFGISLMTAGSKPQAGRSCSKLSDPHSRMSIVSPGDLPRCPMHVIV